MTVCKKRCVEDTPNVAMKIDEMRHKISRTEIGSHLVFQFDLNEVRFPDWFKDVLAARAETHSKN